MAALHYFLLLLVFITQAIRSDAMYYVKEIYPCFGVLTRPEDWWGGYGGSRDNIKVVSDYEVSDGIVDTEVVEVENAQPPLLMRRLMRDMEPDVETVSIRWNPNPACHLYIIKRPNFTPVKTVEIEK